MLHLIICKNNNKYYLDAAYWALSVFADFSDVALDSGADNGFFEYLALGHDKWNRDPKEGPIFGEVITIFNFHSKFFFGIVFYLCTPDIETKSWGPPSPPIFKEILGTWQLAEQWANLALSLKLS